MTGLKQMVLSAAAGAALVSAPVAPANAALPLLLLLGHMLVGHHAVAAAARVTRAPLAAAFSAAESTAPYAYSVGAPPPYRGAAGYYRAPAYYPSAPAYYPSAPAYYPSARTYYRAPAYSASGPAYYSRTPRYYSPPQHPVYYAAPRGYYRPQTYEAARSYGAPRAQRRGSYAFRAAERGRGFGYR